MEFNLLCDCSLNLKLPTWVPPDTCELLPVKTVACVFQFRSQAPLTLEKMTYISCGVMASPELVWNVIISVSTYNSLYWISKLSEIFSLKCVPLEFHTHILIFTNSYLGMALIRNGFDYHIFADIASIYQLLYFKTKWWLNICYLIGAQKFYRQNDLPYSSSMSFSHLFPGQASWGWFQFGPDTEINYFCDCSCGISFC